MDISIILKNIFLVSILFWGIGSALSDEKICVDFTEESIDKVISEALDQDIPKWKESYRIEDKKYLQSAWMVELPPKKSVNETRKLVIQLDGCTLRVIKVAFDNTSDTASYHPNQTMFSMQNDARKI